MAKFAAKDSNKNITLSPHGTGKVVVGTGATDATVQSNGNHDLILQTGNATTGSISIADSTNGDIAISPHGSGKLILGPGDNSGQITTNSTQDLILSTNSGTNSGTITITDGTDGNIQITPNGTGSVVVTTDLDVDYLNLNGNAITSTNTDGNIDLTPNGTGEVNISKVDIDSGTIDGATIATSNIDVSAGTLTTSTAQKQAIMDGAVLQANHLSSSSGTTLANNIQDHITRLGTVTSGTFNNVIGSSATFPNGHILQVVLGNSATESSGTGDQLAVSQSITMSDSSNKLLVFGMLSFAIYSSQSRDQRFGGAKIVTSGSGVTAQSFMPTVADSTGPTGFRLSGPSASTTWQLHGLAPINFLFEPVVAGAVTGAMYGVGYDSDYGTMKVNANGVTHGHSTLILMEVVA